MPRKLKPYPVMEVTDKISGQKIEIFLDRDTKTFFADVRGLQVSAASAKECEALVRAQIKKTTEMEWRKIIVVRAGDVSSTRTLSITYAVHEISQKPNGKPSGGWGYTARQEMPKFDRAEEPQYSYRDYHDCESKSDPPRGIFVMPWSELAENTLKELVQRISDLTTRIRGALAQPDAASLAAAVELLIPAPEKK